MITDNRWKELLTVKRLWMPVVWLLITILYLTISGWIIAFTSFMVCIALLQVAMLTVELEDKEKK